jgi:hypothetical protein
MNLPSIPTVSYISLSEQAVLLGYVSFDSSLIFLLDSWDGIVHHNSMPNIGYCSLSILQTKLLVRPHTGMRQDMLQSRHDV